METQNYQNHRKFKPDAPFQIHLYIFVVTLNLLAIANLCRALYRSDGRTNAILFILTGLSLLAGYFVFRSFALKAQDRSIRAEENLRHFVLTGKLLDKSLEIKQIIALRFAPDEEFVELAERAAKEKLSNADIKKAVKSWKEDHYRV
ncbi:MAG TPA: DUF6526 family protein [Bacteroidia bacterium]|jgi:hypothetical protein|nr:DUF6526 family protein [Bacteroidia bacterium]